MYDYNINISTNYNPHTGDIEGRPIAGTFTALVKWDNSMTYLWDAIMYGDSIDAQAFQFRQGKTPQGANSEFENWFTINMYDGRLSMADLYKQEKADSRMGDEVVTLSISYKAIRFADYKSYGDLVVAQYNWADKSGKNQNLPNLRG